MSSVYAHNLGGSSGEAPRLRGFVARELGRGRGWMVVGRGVPILFKPSVKYFEDDAGSCRRSVGTDSCLIMIMII